MPPSPQALPATRRAKGAVIKKLSPGMPGTRRLLERYGAALVCVRYREIETPDGAHRLTTVELVVDERQGKARDAWLRIAYDETELRRAIKQAGGVWDSQRRLWRAPARAIKQLGLADRVVEKA
jgi:hypothetical protein